MAAPIVEVAASFTELASGLRFPEAPVALADRSVVVAEIAGGRITMIAPDGTVSTIAEVAGAPNGLALGPDGALYVANNGGSFSFLERGPLLLPGRHCPSTYVGGSIQRVTLAGEVTALYTECNGWPLRSPNDLVFDAHGGMWFTDHGIVDHCTRRCDLSALYYAKSDGSKIREVAFPTHSPNGIGLSPDGSLLYYSETYTGRVYRRRILEPGLLEPLRTMIELDAWALLVGLPDGELLDSLAVDAEGWVNVASVGRGGVISVASDGSHLEHRSTGDRLTTNIAFDALDNRTAYVTLSSTGRLVAMRWDRPGLRLHYQ